MGNRENDRDRTRLAMPLSCVAEVGEGTGRAIRNPGTSQDNRRPESGFFLGRTRAITGTVQAPAKSEIPGGGPIEGTL